jgi:hypothetical protein
MKSISCKNSVSSLFGALTTKKYNEAQNFFCTAYGSLKITLGYQVLIKFNAKNIIFSIEGI